MIDYSKLPDAIDYDEWRRCFIEFLFDNQNVIEKNKLYVFEQLYEIAQREVWEILDDAVIDAISDFILRNIDYENFDIMDTVTSIIPMIGLKDVWNTIVSKKVSINEPRVVKLIEECDAEYGEHVEDPFWDYKQQIKGKVPNK